MRNRIIGGGLSVWNSREGPDRRCRAPRIPRQLHRRVRLGALYPADQAIEVYDRLREDGRHITWRPWGSTRSIAVAWKRASATGAMTSGPMRPRSRPGSASRCLGQDRRIRRPRRACRTASRRAAAAARSVQGGGGPSAAAARRTPLSQRKFGGAHVVGRARLSQRAFPVHGLSRLRAGRDPG